MNMPSVNGTITKRPAETGGVVGAVTLLIVKAVGVTDPDVIVALGVVIGFVPAAITFIAGLIRHRPSN